MLPVGYTYEELKPNDKRFIDGMRYVLNDRVDNFKHNYLEVADDTEMPTVSAIKNEIVTATINELEKILSIDIDEMIISILDGYEEE